MHMHMHRVCDEHPSCQTSNMPLLSDSTCTHELNTYVHGFTCAHESCWLDKPRLHTYTHTHRHRHRHTHTHTHTLNVVCIHTEHTYTQATHKHVFYAATYENLMPTLVCGLGAIDSFTIILESSGLCSALAHITGARTHTHTHTHTHTLSLSHTSACT
jgi:hypothetical protein